MIPEQHDYLSFLMGADAISDHELTDLGVKILKGASTPFRGLLVPGGSLPGYKALIRDKLTPGFWNDIVGRHEILFIFKLKDSSVRELALSDATRPEIARLCSSLNNDPIGKTSDMPRYLAGNPFYREAIEAFHGHAHAMSDGSEADGLQLARFMLRLTFVIFSGIGFAVSALLIALAFVLERLYSVPALPWAFATLALPACGLVALALSTRLAKFVANTATIVRVPMSIEALSGDEPNNPVQPTRPGGPRG